MEHVELVKHILYEQKRRNRDINVVLLDLKNAFEEVHHSLIRFALEQHHVTEPTIQLILSQYSAFCVNIKVPDCDISSGPVLVKQGVLQGDTLSPLLFNLVFDSLMSSLKRPELKNCGILWGDGNIRTAWTQFADDAIVISGTLNETQFMLNLFQRWTNWADLIIRPDKCCAYAASKRNGLYQQITQSLSVDGKAIPAVQIGESFTYLGHNFAFATELVSAKAGLLAKMHK